MNTCMGFGIFAAVWAVTPLAELWSCLGGTLHQVQTRFGIILPEFLVLILLAAATAAHSIVAAQIAPWATEYGTLALLWQSSCALLAILAMLEVIIAVAVWGPTFLVHAWTAIVFVPLAIILTATSSVTLARASGMLSFVGSHWVDHLVYAVPPHFSSLAPARYASASYFPATAAGAAGLMLAIFLWLGVIMHARCAVIMLSVGAELKALALQPRTTPGPALGTAGRPVSQGRGYHALQSVPEENAASEDGTSADDPLVPKVAESE
jgi:hypothetical protein